MWNLTENELIRLVTERIDPDDIVELLHLSSSDLAEAFSDKLVLHSKELQEFMNFGDNGYEEDLELPEVHEINYDDEYVDEVDERFLNLDEEEE